MAKPNSQFEELARDAAANVQAAREAGEQLTFLPDEPVEGDTARKARGKNKAISQLRDHLAAKGFRLPEDVLVEMAGMASGQDAFLSAIARTEQVLVWAQEGAAGYKASPVAPSLSQRIDLFKFVFTAQIRAAEALLPYGLGKVTPDVVAPLIVPVIMPAPPVPQTGITGPMRDITPRLDDRMLPADVAWQIEQNQRVSDAVLTQSDVKGRTE